MLQTSNLLIIAYSATHKLLYPNTNTNTNTHTYTHTIAPNEFLPVQQYQEHTIAQTRELEATKALLPQVLEQGGILHACEHLLPVFMVTMYMCVYTDLKIMEVAHDNATFVKSYITEDLHLFNSYNTWYGGLTDFQIFLTIITAFFRY